MISDWGGRAPPRRKSRPGEGTVFARFSSRPLSNATIRCHRPSPLVVDPAAPERAANGRRPSRTRTQPRNASKLMSTVPTRRAPTRSRPPERPNANRVARLLQPLGVLPRCRRCRSFWVQPPRNPGRISWPGRGATTFFEIVSRVGAAVPAEINTGGSFGPMRWASRTSRRRRTAPPREPPTPSADSSGGRQQEGERGGPGRSTRRTVLATTGETPQHGAPGGAVVEPVFAAPVRGQDPANVIWGHRRRSVHPDPPNRRRSPGGWDGR